MGKSRFRSVLALAALVAVAQSVYALDGITLLKRDYSGAVTATDSTWFYLNEDGSARPNGEGVYPWPEHDYNRNPKSFPVVQAKGGALNIALHFFYFPALFDEGNASGTFSLLGARLAIPPTSPGGSTTYYTLNVSPSSLNVVFPPGGPTVVNVTLSNLPGYVTRGTLEVSAKVSIGGVVVWNTGGYQPWETVYVTYSTPIGVIDQPWTDLLEWVCKWGHGENDPTEISKKVALGLNEAMHWIYNPGGNWCWEDPNQNNGLTYGYKLKVALIGTNEFDCRDVSGFTYLGMLALGVQATTHRTYSPGPEPNTVIPYKTNLACPMGTIKIYPPQYQHYSFNFHQYLICAGGVSDAAVAYTVDLAGNVWQEIPLAWSPDGYWLAASGSWGIAGHVYGYYDSPAPEYIPKAGFEPVIQWIK